MKLKRTIDLFLLHRKELNGRRTLAAKRNLVIITTIASVFTTTAFV